jgi:hypothetical protein
MSFEAYLPTHGQEQLQAERPLQASMVWSILHSKREFQKCFCVLAQPQRFALFCVHSKIEAVFVDALFDGFDQGMEPGDMTIANVLTAFVLLSKLMAEPIDTLKKCAKERAEYATTQIITTKLRKMG